MHRSTGPGGTPAWVHGCAPSAWLVLLPCTCPACWEALWRTYGIITPRRVLSLALSSAPNSRPGCTCASLPRRLRRLRAPGGAGPRRGGGGGAALPGHRAALDLLAAGAGAGADLPTGAQGQGQGQGEVRQAVAKACRRKARVLRLGRQEEAGEAVRGALAAAGGGGDGGLRDELQELLREAERGEGAGGGGGGGGQGCGGW